MAMKSMTDENVEAWEQLKPEWQKKRLQDWANMLEKRVSELDPNYRAYQFGRLNTSRSRSEDIK